MKKTYLTLGLAVATALLASCNGSKENKDPVVPKTNDYQIGEQSIGIKIEKVYSPYEAAKARENTIYNLEHGISRVEQKGYEYNYYEPFSQATYAYDVTSTYYSNGVCESVEVDTDTNVNGGVTITESDSCRIVSAITENGKYAVQKTYNKSERVSPLSCQPYTFEDMCQYEYLKYALSSDGTFAVDSNGNDVYLKNFITVYGVSGFDKFGNSIEVNQVEVDQTLITFSNGSAFTGKPSRILSTYRIVDYYDQNYQISDKPYVEYEDVDETKISYDKRTEYKKKAEFIEDVQKPAYFYVGNGYRFNSYDVTLNAEQTDFASITKHSSTNFPRFANDVQKDGRLRTGVLDLKTGYSFMEGCAYDASLDYSAQKITFDSEGVPTLETHVAEQSFALNKDKSSLPEGLKFMTHEGKDYIYCEKAYHAQSCYGYYETELDEEDLTKIRLDTSIVIK